MRSIGVVTVGRSDYGIYLPLLKRIKSDADLKLLLIVAGMHLSPEFGMTVKVIEADGFKIAERVEMLMSSDTPRGIAMSMGIATLSYATVYENLNPDILVVLGDRYEMHAAVVAALPFKIPVAHIHGGELTLGAFDDALRHSMTKLSHLHFVTTSEYAHRVLQLGEEPWRVVLCGSLSLDNLELIQLLKADELTKRFGFGFTPPPLLVTLHPATLEYEKTGSHITELLAALDEIDMPIVFTQPNADTASRTILAQIRQFVGSHPACILIENMGTQAYFSLMANASAMVGNSSSGIIEAASFHLPVVNIGNRQNGRVKPANVIDSDNHASEIVRNIRKALSAEFADIAKRVSNPYKRANATNIIVETLRNTPIDDRLIMKRFHSQKH